MDDVLNLSKSYKSKRITQLGIILFLAFGIFLIVLYSEKKVKEDLTTSFDTLTKVDGERIKALCLNGSQADRSRVCPKIIREANEKLTELVSACFRFKAGDIAFLGVSYSCDQTNKFRDEIQQFTNAIGSY